MSEHSRLLEGVKSASWQEHSAGRELRNQLFDQITPILSLSDDIRDPSVRLVIQAYCLDMVTTLEDLIACYELDGYPASVEC